MWEKKIHITAHAGCNGTRMDTIESVEVGILSGADIIEIDLNLDENQNLILCHDAPKRGIDYPGLEKVLELIKYNSDILLNIDIKNIKILEALNCIISKYGLEDKVFYTGINYEDIINNKEKLQGRKYFINLEPPKLDLGRLHNEKYLSEVLGDQMLKEILGINIYYKIATEELLYICKKKGFLCSVWTVEHIEHMTKMINLEVDNITTRQVDMLKNLMCKNDGNICLL